MPKISTDKEATRRLGEAGVRRYTWADYLLLGEQSFRKDKYPGIHVLKAFVEILRVGMPPPPWITDYLRERFEEFLRDPSKRSLDKLFGLRGGRGQDPAFKKMLIDDRNDELCSQLHQLRRQFHISTEHAAYMVIELEKHHRKNGQGGPGRLPSEKTLINLYGKAPKDKRNYWDLQDELRGPKNEKERDDFLKTFPEYSLPKDHYGHVTIHRE